MIDHCSYFPALFLEMELITLLMYIAEKEHVLTSVYHSIKNKIQT